MVDTLSKEERSRIMSCVRSKNTKPEILVRHLIWELGYRYRLQVHELPGKPDIVFRRQKKVIFVHGCFWHRHQGCPNNRTPKSRIEFWSKKFVRNQQKDSENYRLLNDNGWQFLIIWECEIKKNKFDILRSKIIEFMEN